MPKPKSEVQADGDDEELPLEAPGRGPGERTRWDPALSVIVIFEPMYGHPEVGEHLIIIGSAQKSEHFIPPGEASERWGG